jgi:hypothetical protein
MFYELRNVTMYLTHKLVGVGLIAALFLAGCDNADHRIVSRPHQSPSPQLHTEKMADQAFAIKAGGYQYTKFTVPPGATNAKFQGHFSATGGMHSDVEVWLTTEDGFVNWRNGNSANNLYTSGRVTQDTLNVSLPGAGSYYLVFSNKFSFISPKAVQINGLMTFYQ